MKCPTCGKGSDVIDSRQTLAGVRRRRECLNEHRFTTIEQIPQPSLAAQLRAFAATLETPAKAETA